MLKTMGFPDAVASMIDFLPDSKQPLVRDILRRFEEREVEIERRAGGFLTTDDRERLYELTREKRRALSELMTPDELENYELRASFTADRLKWKLAIFQPTEQEYRALFRLEREFDEQFNPYPQYQNSDPDFQKRMLEASQKLESDIRKTLGEERHGAYQLSQDQGYRALMEVGQRYELSHETVARIYELKRIAEEQIQQVRQGGIQNQEQAGEIVRATSQQTIASVRALLGEKAFQDYVKRGGYWLLNLGH